MSKSKFISKIKEMFSNEDIFEDTVEDVVVSGETKEAFLDASAFATKESVNDLKATLEEMKSLLTSREKVIDGLIESFSKFSKEPNGKATKKETKFSSDLKSGTMSQEDKMKFFSDRKRK